MKIDEIKYRLFQFIYIIKNGGLKLKLIGFSVSVISITVIILSLFIINLMSDSIEKKSFEVITSSIREIGNVSRLALLERSHENKINLSEIIKEIKDAKIEGFLDISIYEREKDENNNKYIYLTGFKEYNTVEYLENKKLIEKFNNAKNEKILLSEIILKRNNKEIDIIQFIKPIFYTTFQNQTILLGTIVLNYEKEAITGVVKDVINIAILITVIIILLTSVLIYFAGLRFTKPILSIADAADNVAYGNLNIDLDINTNDEIGILANHFNKMVNGLREREKMQKFVSDSTMDMIQEDTKSKLILGGEYRTLTFLFSDIRGFTAMSERKNPDEVVKIINYYLNIQSEIIKDNGGDIDKFVGDEIMASFSGENSLEDAINCALEIQKNIIENNFEREKVGKTVCQVGIGINKGDVVVGNIGSYERMDFTSIGSVVNLAARLCSSAGADEILISKDKLKEINSEYKIIEKEAILLKGISQPIEVCSVVF